MLCSHAGSQDVSGKARTFPSMLMEQWRPAGAGQPSTGGGVEQGVGGNGINWGGGTQNTEEMESGAQIGPRREADLTHTDSQPPSQA